MIRTRRRVLEFDVLEARDVPDATTEPMVPPPPSGGTGIIDPTFDPSDPGATSVQVTVTALGSVVNGQLTSVTVSGLTAANLQAGSSYRLVIGGTSYTVSLVSPNAGGNHVLSLSQGIPSSAVAVGTTGTLVIGNGANQPPTGGGTPITTPSDPSLIPIIDPTLLPTP